jgi:hypothetical protein
LCILSFLARGQARPNTLRRLTDAVAAGQKRVFALDVPAVDV